MSFAECQICGISSQEVRLVRDHNHVTGNFRGVLCDFCNTRLGSYERDILGQRYYVKRGYKAWRAKCEDRIILYLSQETSTPFSQVGKLPLVGSMCGGRSTNPELPVHPDGPVAHDPISSTQQDICANGEPTAGGFDRPSGIEVTFA